MASMDNKRIAIFIPTLEGGGAESTMVILAQGLQTRGCTVDLILKQRRGELSQNIPESINVIDFNVSIMRYTLKKLVEYEKNYHPDAIISALELPNMTSILASKAVRGCPRVIISIHGLISKQKPIYNQWFDRLLFSATYPFADDIVTVSQTCAQDAIQYLHLPKSKVKVIYNPIISEGLYQRAEEPILHAWFGAKSKKTILSIGRLESVKDHKTLLKAFKLVREREEAQLVILGEGTLKAEIQQVVNKIGLSEEVLMPGFISNPYPIIANADVLVISSLHEALPNVLVEALACQCPVVSTACGGPEEILGYGKYGHLVPIGDHEAMAAAIVKVLKGDKRLATPEWLEQFSVDRNIDAYLNLFENK